MKNVIVITGASSGMGKETAKTLINAGHTVYGAARRLKEMEDLKAMGGHIAAMDITDHEQIRQFINRVIQEQEKIDVLINNAGYGLYGAVEDIAISDAKKQFEVNIFGLAAITKTVLPHMRKQGGGKIINISSMGGKIYTPLGAWYHASKHALEGWSDCLRLELNPFNIDVVIIEPGIIATEFGNILYEPMLQHSGKGPYKKLAHAMAAATKESYSKKGASSPPSVIANIILKAIATSYPKTRYVKGKMAGLMIALRKNLGDRLFDRIIMSQVK